MAGTEPASAGPAEQEAGLLVFGFVRPDGVVEPVLHQVEGEWVRDWNNIFEFPEPNLPWAQVGAYYARDFGGVEAVLNAGPPVRICCDGQGNDTWAHSTDRSGEDVEKYLYNQPQWTGYAFSRQLTDAAFGQTSQSVGVNVYDLVISDTATHDRFEPGARRPARSHVDALLNSLAPIPDSVLPLSDTRRPVVGIDLWEAEFDGVAHAFVQVTQVRRSPGYECFRMVGWLTDDDPPQIDVTSSGYDDCEYKGHGTRTPYALFRIGEATYMILGGEEEGLAIFRHVSETTWSRVQISGP
ncbi:MAG: hypothetical protein ABMA15_24520 [Vicinamibacterales bacterium]